MGKTRSPPAPGRSLAQLCPDMKQMCPDWAAGPESCHLEGDFERATGKARHTGCWIYWSFQQGRQGGPLAAGSVCSQDPRVGGRIQGLPSSPHDKLGLGEANQLCVLETGGDSRLLRHGISEHGRLPGIRLCKLKAQGSPHPSVSRVLTRYQA